MATSRQSISFRQLWPGLVIAGVIVLLASSTLAILLFYADAQAPLALWQDDYLRHVIGFTFWQALLSTILSLLPAIPLSRALFRRHFPGRTLLLRLCAMTLILPVLVAIFGLISIYGKQGWLAVLLDWFNVDYHYSLYGLQGILLAHVFFNLPLATRLLLQSLEQISVEQRQLSAQLGMSEWQHFCFVEWPALQRQLLPTAGLIFTLCFASFTVVMALGGGPQATTIELAIYQSLHYDLDLNRAAILGVIQLICCSGLLLITHKLTQVNSSGHTLGKSWRNQADSLLIRLIDYLWILAGVLFIVPPILAVIVNGLSPAIFKMLQQPTFWQALFTSLRISLASGLLCLILTLMLLWSSRELRIRGLVFWGHKLELCGTLILAMPVVVLATGCFLLFKDMIGPTQQAYSIVILLNALMALPFSLKILNSPMLDLAERYHFQIQSLGMNPWQRLYWVELLALQRPLAQAMAFACVLSIGDFGAIALFGNADFLTLPFYLYQQIGAYRSNNAAVTAFLLLLLCFFLFTLLEKLPDHYANTRTS